LWNFSQALIGHIYIVIKNGTLKKEPKIPITLGRIINSFNNLLVVERSYFKDEFVNKVSFASSCLMLRFSWNSIGLYSYGRRP